MRAVVWTQGCSLGCVGCFNPETHSTNGQEWEPPLLAAYLASPEIEGLTISGGEPFDQWAATLDLLESWRRVHPGSTLVLSGYTLDRLESLHPPGEMDRLHEALDVLIAGRYMRHLHLGSGLRGSSNKRVHLFSNRHSLEEIETIPTTEIVIQADGSVVSTGVDPVWVARS